MSALLSLAYGTFWRLSWWDYHIYLLAGFAAAAWAVVAGYRGSRTLVGAVGGITVRDPLEQVAHGQPDALHALIGAVEAKDPYTHGHSVRVAELSTRIGLLLALEPEAVRGLHQGAFLHDVGKISVPDQVLNKPGDLDPDGVGADPAASRGRVGSGEPRRLAPRSAVGDPPPPRTMGRYRLPGSPGRNATSRSPAASSRSPTSGTPSPPTARTVRPGTPTARSRTSPRRAGPCSTRRASRRSSTWWPRRAWRRSAPARTSTPLRAPPRIAIRRSVGHPRRPPTPRPSPARSRPANASLRQPAARGPFAVAPSRTDRAPRRRDRR